MLIPELQSLGPAQEFPTAFGNQSAKLLGKFGLSVTEPSAEQDVDRLIGLFSQGWRNLDATAPAVDVSAVRAAIDIQDARALWLWGLAREQLDCGPMPLPKVAIASVSACSNPFITTNESGEALLVMPSGFWMLFVRVLLGVLILADGPSSHQQASLTLIRSAAREWRTRDPSTGPGGRLMAEMSTLDLDATTLAVGLGHAAFLWTYLHELGHHVMRHQATHSFAVGMLSESEMPGGAANSSVQAYAHEQEIDADRFGYEGLLRLIPLEQMIRSHDKYAIEFGQQIDHAPLIVMEIVHLALRLEGRVGSLATESHPAPVSRRDLLQRHGQGRVCEAGRDFYWCWHERLLHACEVLKVKLDHL